MTFLSELVSVISTLFKPSEDEYGPEDGQFMAFNVIRTSKNFTKPMSTKERIARGIPEDNTTNGPYNTSPKPRVKTIRRKRRNEIAPFCK
jgi:hypothetical protein